MIAGSSGNRPRSNLYIVLDILPGASHGEILHAYNRAKNTYSTGSLAGYSLMEDEHNLPILEEIEKAYEILGNPSKRREYDISMGFQTWGGDESRGSTRLAGGAPSIASKNIPDTDNLLSSLQTSSNSAASQSSSSPMTPPKVAAVQPTKTPSPAQQQEAVVVQLVQPQFEANPDFEKQINECTEIDGAFLKAVRIYRRLSQEQVAMRCKLSPSHVMAVEEEDGTKLHHSVYLRGHVSMICRILAIPNPDALARHFVLRMQALKKLPTSPF